MAVSYGACFEKPFVVGEEFSSSRFWGKAHLAVASRSNSDPGIVVGSHSKARRDSSKLEKNY